MRARDLGRVDAARVRIGGKRVQDVANRDPHVGHRFCLPTPGEDELLVNVLEQALRTRLSAVELASLRAKLVGPLKNGGERE